MIAVADLPFREREILDLLALDLDAPITGSAYAGYGWARVPEITLSDADATERTIEDALVIACHSSDVQPEDVGDDDLELEFELPDGEPVAVLASRFLAVWLPVLPRASAIVLAICNKWQRTYPRRRDVPIHAARGDVVAWLDDNDGGETRLRLAADSWYVIDPA